MSEIRVDTISEKTSANGVSIDGLTIKDGGITATTGAIVFNEAGADLDFRVESNGNANMLKVDGGNNRVGVGCDPSADFHVDSSGGGVIRVSRNSASTSNFMALESDGTNGTVKAVQSLIVSAGGGEVARFTSGGLAIGGTGAANTLDDYEEGTWTPVLGSTGSYSGQQYAQQVGNYTKIGRQVTLHMVIQLTDAGTVGDYSTIFGLPFTPASTSEGSIPFAVWKITLTSGHSPIGIFYTGGSARIYLQQQDGAGTLDQVAASGVADDARLYMTATFLV